MSIRLTGMASGLDTDSMIKELMSAYSAKKDKDVKASTKHEWTMAAWKETNSKVYSFYTGALSSMKFSKLGSLRKATISNSSVASITASNSAPVGTHKLSVMQLATSGYMTGGEITTKSGESVGADTRLSELGLTNGTIKVNDTEIKIDGNMTMSKLASQMREAGVEANFDAASGRFFVSSKASGSDGEFTITAGDEQGIDALMSLGLMSVTDINGDETAEMAKYRELAESGLNTKEAAAARKIVEMYDAGELENSSESARISAQDAVIKLNGATFTSNTNSFSINGLTIEATAVTTKEIENADGSVTIKDEPVTITTSVDSQGIYDKIKNFLKAYNEMIGHIDGLYYADSAKGYEPLTTEEKDALTDKEVEEWEQKVKDALLRKDSTLGGISSALKNVFLGMSYTTESGKTYNIAALGIGTGNYFSTDDKDRGKFHINGDKDDEATAASADKLMAAIAADPEGVSEFFSKLADKLYSTLDDKMKSTTLSSAFTIYNDKQMSSQYSEYKKKLSDWDTKLDEIEEKYAKQFAAMEKALEQLNAKQSSLAQMLGTA